MGRRIMGLIVATLLLVVTGWAVPSSAGADATPWTWASATGSGVSTAAGVEVTARCPEGYSAVSGGVDTGAHIRWQNTFGGSFLVNVASADPTPVTVRAWCSSSGRPHVLLFDSVLNSEGRGDFPCPPGMTPLSASLTWNENGSGHINQTGPETIGGKNEWFVVAVQDNSHSRLQVELSCVADADMPGASWVAQSQTAGPDGATETVTATCPDGQRLITGGEHVDSVQDLPVRSYPVGAQAWTAAANVPPHDTLSVLVLCIADGDPVASFTSVPRSPTNSTSATFTFTAVDPSAVSTASNWCFLNTVYLGSCSGSYTVTGLAEGQNVFSIEAITGDGRGGASTEQDDYFQVDLTPPTVSVTTPAFTLGTTVNLRASGTDAQGIDHYRVVETARRAAGAGAGAADPVVTSRTTTTGLVSVPVKAGMSYRFDVTAIDRATNVSRVRSVSTGVPLDNLALTASGPWSLVKGAAYTNGLVSRTRARGATLTHSMFGRTLGVVATTCPTCGKVGVYAGTRLLTTIDLGAGGTHYRQVFTVPVGSTPVQAQVVLKVLSTDKLIEIDGLGARIS